MQGTKHNFTLVHLFFLLFNQSTAVTYNHILEPSLLYTRDFKYHKETLTMM